MRRSVLHSNLLDRLGNSLLKFVLLVVMVCNVKGGVFAVEWSKSGTYTGNESLGSTKTIPLDVSIKIDGSLTLSAYTGNLTVKGTLYITGNFTLNTGSSLTLEDGSTLIVGGNLNQKASILFCSHFDAQKAKIIVNGNYIANTSLIGTSDVLDATQNEVYVFGNSAVSGTLSGTNFYDKYESFETVFLPIELTSFTATATEYGYTFNWVTASEVENDYFTLEYSIDGVDFNEIDYIHGAGTTSETSEYEYRWNEAPEFDVVYFRLKQTDYNGEYSYSDVIVASHKKSSGANGTFRYGPLNLQIVDGELRYIQK